MKSGRVPSTDETTIFVYDAAGKLAPSTPAPRWGHPSSDRRGAEYSTVVADVEDAKVAYLTADHLGSPRINTDQNGAVTSRHDYHPYGEEIITAQRIAALGYASDTIRKQFTGYERDSESGLDFAQARYYWKSLGRFSSSDPILLSIDRLGNPQLLNLYAYAGNSPLRFLDPTGEEILQLGDEGVKAMQRQIEKLKAEMNEHKERASDLTWKLKELSAKLDFVKQANKIVGGWIETLKKHGGNQNLTLSELKISTTPGYDLATIDGEMAKRPGATSRMSTDLAQKLRSDASTIAEVLDGQIYVFSM